MQTTKNRIFGAGILLLLFTIGCGGVDPAPDDMLGGPNTIDMASADGGSLELFAACSANDQCQSGLCSQISYDRSPTPLCTYKCDASNTNAKCPAGCNPKGYCKQPK